MKTRYALAAAVAVSMTSLVTFADGSTWYLIKTETSFQNMCHNAASWSSDGTTDGERSGADGVPLDSSDRYVINAKKAVRLAPDKGQYTGPSVFTCKRITFGEPGNANYGSARCYSNGNRYVDFGRGEDQEGVYLHNGYILAYKSYPKQSYTGTLTGKMTVTASEEEPFRITTAYDNSTMQVTGTVFRAAIGTGLCIGGLTGDETGDATNFQFCAYCDMSEFFGRMTVEPCCTSIEEYPDFDTTLHVGSMEMPGTLELEAGAVLAPTGAACVVTLGNANFVGGSRITFPVENVEGSDGVIRPRCPLIVVTNAVSASGVVTFEFSGDAEIPADGLTNRLALVVAKKGGLDKTNFAIELSDALDPSGWYGKYGVSLEVEEDETTGEQTLVAVFQPLVKMIYSDAGSKSSGATRLAVTNAAAWSDGKLPHSGAHYLITSGVEVTGKNDGKAFMFTATTNGTYFFPGESLTIASNANMYVFSDGFSVPVLRLMDGAALRGGQGHVVAFSNMVLVAESGVVEFSVFGPGSQFNIYGDLRGSAEVRLGTQTLTSVPQGTNRFYGDNSEFVGTLVVSQYMGGASYSRFSGGKVQKLCLRKATDFGGALETFNPAALLVSQFDRIVLEDDVSISTNLNRGLTVTGDAVVDTDSHSLGLGMPLTIDGTLYKDGAGILQLNADRAAVGADGGNIVVTNGTLAIAAADAVNGFAVHLAPDAALSLKVDLEDETLTRYGIRNVGLAEPFVLGSGVTSLPLSVDVANAPLPKRGGTIGVLTVSDSATNAIEQVFSVPKSYRGFRFTRQKLHDDENGWTTYAAKYEPIGIVISVW